MRQIYRELRAARKHSGLSQQRLSQLAGISLATLQNIEAGRANPELSTLLAITASLGIDIQLVPRNLDFGRLSELGVPIASEDMEIVIRLSSEELKRELNKLVNQLNQIKKGSREEKSLVSYLSALADHYPSFWSDLALPLKDWYAGHLSLVSPKLRRISLSRLSQFL